MKRIALVFAFTSISFLSKAQNMTDLNARMTEIEDKIAIKNLVDTFSILADTKDIAKQVLLFTENATVTSKVNGQPGNILTGRKQIGDAFSNFLSLFGTVYHCNGQQTVTLNGDTASGLCYCMVTLIGIENGKKMKTAMGVYYNDEYVKEKGHWLIAKRSSTFAWQEKKEMSQ